MIRKTLYFAGVAALSSIAATSAPAMPYTLEEHAVMQDLMAPINLADVDRLEIIGNGFVTSKERLPEGKWKLNAYHYAFRQFVRGGQIDMLEALIAKWRKAYPQSRIAPVVHADFLMDYAFKVRGGGYYSEVWDDDRKVFHAKMSEAAAVLEASKAVASDNPHWYMAMVNVKAAMGEPAEDFVAVAREGLAREPGYIVTARVAMNFLMPRWGGSAEWARTWIDEAARATRSVEGDGVYAWLAWHTIGFERDFGDLAEVIDWDRLKVATDEFVDRHPAAINRDAALKAACTFHDPKEVEKRYSVIVRMAGPRMTQKIDPPKLCRWEVVQGRDPGVISPDKLPRLELPRKASGR